jgi:hypothetical protein
VLLVFGGSNQILPTFHFRFQNSYERSGFQLDRYTYVDTLELNAPSRLTYIEPNSGEFNTLTFKLLPNALIDVYEPNKFMTRYRCVGNNELGFHLNVTTSISKDYHESIESFDLEIEMRYIGKNLRRTMSNGGIRYRARIFKQDNEYQIKDHTFKVFGDEHEPGFSMRIRHSFIETNPSISPDSNIHVEIIPNQQYW